MKKAFFVSNALLICCLLLSFSHAVTAQISATNYTAPAMEQTRTEQTPLTRSRKEWDSVRAVRLNELTAAEQQANQNASGKKALRIGIARQLPRHIESLSDFTAQSTAQGTLYLLRVISPGAKSLRLHFKSLQLPAGAHLFVSSRQNAQMFSPAYTDKRAEFWTPSLPSEEVIIECFVPSKAAMEKAVAPFQMDAVNHIFRAPRESNSAQIESAGACNQEVPAEFSEAAKATALIAFSKSDGEYVCSGTLMADINKSGTPYFLTANHCIGNGGEAASAEVYWNYNSGPEPTTTPTRGASLLATDQADDFSLLQLSAKPPGGVVYSGWTSVAQPINTSVTGIHHPQADYKRASFGKIVEASCISEIPAEFCDFFAKVRWDRGITEGGSSGSGIFIGTGNQTQMIGILSGGESSCDNQAGADYYGRISRIFGAIGYYLTNEGICRYTLLQDRFSYGQTGGNGEFTIVPKIGGENCPWQARSNVNWVTITSGTSGTALGKVAFQVAANTSDKPRVGAISIAGRNVVIFQAPAIAPASPCAATKIQFGQTITGDLRTATCSSLFDPTMTAMRYAVDAEAGQSVSIAFRQILQTGVFHLIYPDGKVVPIRNSYPTVLPIAGTYLIELALPPSENSTPVPFDFTAWKGCTIKISPNYFEADGFGQITLPTPGSFARLTTEIIGENCFTPGTVADEPGIDDNKIYMPYHPIEKAVLLTVNAAQDTRQRYIVARIFDQPFIIKQIPRCSSATTFSYTPSQLNPSSTGGIFQMQVKRTAGPSCSWEVKPYEKAQNGESETRDILIQPENYSNWARGNDEGTVTYKVPINSYFRTRNYLLKNGDQLAQTITQPFAGETCSRPVLQVGQSANGTLATTDCNWYESGQYVDVYQLNLAVGEQYAVELSGTAGSEITAELGILEYGSNGYVGDLKQKAVVRSPETGFGTAYTPGTYALRVFGKPGSYQIKLLGIGPAGCVYKLNKEGEILVPAETTNFAVQLDCNRGDCDWTAQSSTNWITFPQGGSGKGSQSVSLTLAPNTGARRQATITIAGRSFTLAQDYSCSYRKYTTAAPNKFFASYEGGSYRYWVETSATCTPPTISPSTDWIQGISPQPYQVIINVAPNTGGFRKGAVTIAGEVFEVLQGGNDLAVTTAADYQRTVSPGSLVSVFNQGMSAFSEAAQSLPLPTTLANSAVVIEQSDGSSVLAPLLFVSPSQINFFLPESITPGRTKIQVLSGGLSVGGGSSLYGSGTFDVSAIAPNVFTADSTGKGPAAAEIQRIRPGQPVVYEPTFGTGIDEQGKPIAIARPITIGTGDERTFLVLYATGVRKRIPNAAVTAQIGDVIVPVEYAGAQGQFVGLDQINIQLPPSLRGKGLVNVTVTIDGKTTNPVQINIAP